MNPIDSLFKWERTPVGKILAESKSSLMIVFWLTFLVELLSLAPILYMINLFDRVLASRSLTTLISLTVLIVAVVIFWTAIEWIRTRILIRLSLRIDWDLAPEVFDAAFRSQLGKRKINVQQLLTDLYDFRKFFLGRTLISLMAVPFGITFIGFAALIHPYLAAFVALSLISLLVAAYFTQKIASPILRASNDHLAEANRKANMFTRQAETTYALGMLPAARKQWYESHREYLALQLNAGEATGLTGGFAGFLNKSFPSLAKALIALLVLQQLVNPVFIFVGALLIMRAIGPLQSLLRSWPAIVKALQAFDRLNDLLEKHHARKQQMPLPAPVGRVEVKNLVGVPPFGKKRVVDGVGFRLEPGEAVAIVGISASGKSSLAKLMLGIWRPALGSVRIDGVEISDWDHDLLGPLLGYVPQEISFFEGTIAENIARLGPVDSEKVVKAARLVDMHEAILGFPKGYETRIGALEEFALSGGQKQRLAIARALYDDPKYVVMDEPNANLDEKGEQALLSAIRYLKSIGSTTIVTTHRARLIAGVEYLLVLRAGKQVAFGPASEVIEGIRALVSPTNDIEGVNQFASTPSVKQKIAPA